MSLFLQVSITVPNKQDVDFSNQLKVVLRDQAFADWKLEGGFKLTEELDPKDFDASPSRRSAGETEFVNVWRLPEGSTSSDVAAKMVRLSETESYVALDAKVHTEIQEIVYLISAPSDPRAWDAIRDQKARTGAIARVRYYPFRTNISSLVFTVGAAAPEWEAKTGWTFLGMFQNITGLLNEFWAYWYVPKPDGVGHFDATLKGLTSKDDRLMADLRASTESSGAIWTLPPTPTPTATTAPAPDSRFHDGLALLVPADYWRGDQ